MVSARPSPNQIEGNLRVHGGQQGLDPMQLLAQLQAPNSNNLMNDAYAQVAGPYEAQLEALARQAAAARNKQQGQDRELAAMYGGLQKQIRGDEAGIKSNYNDAWNSVGRNTQAGIRGINSTYSQTRNELGDLFSRLGIQAAAPDALREGASDQALLSGLMQIRGNSAQQGITTDKAAALQFNTSQGHSAGLQGNERRADLMEMLNERLAGIGDQENNVQGQMAGALNQRQYQLEQDAMQRQMQLQGMLMEQAENAGGGSQLAMTPAQEYAQMGPDEKGFYKASQLFGGNAGYAMQLIGGVANNQNGGIYQNPAHFIRSVLAENMKQQQAGRPALSDTELQALASFFWDQGGTGRRPDREY